MAKLSKTWWGQKFIEALEGFTDSGRLSRGRSYSSDRRILKFEMGKHGVVSATVRGNVNPYFGVYKEPKYRVKLQLTAISEKNWEKAIRHIGGKASLVSKLLMNEMPDDIDAAFRDVKLHFLPRGHRDFQTTDCSCPDYANPCKHIAGVYYRLAGLLDQDPFLLFELRGLPRDDLRDALRKSPFGEIPAGMMTERDTPLEPATSYYPRPQPGTETPTYARFWRAPKPLPTEVEAPSPASVPALMVKKAGDHPAFWPKDHSFIEMMEETYTRVRKNKVL